MLDDRAALRLAVAARKPHPGLQPFQRSHLRVRALVDRLAARFRSERIENRLAPEFRAGREELHHQHVGIAVDDEARQAVRFAVHQAQRIAVLEGRQGMTKLNRLIQSCFKEGFFNPRAGLETPDPRANLRLRAPGRHRDRLAGGFDQHRLAVGGLAVHLLDGAGKDPRMAALERFVAPRLQVQRFHFLRARGCAAS